MHRKTVDDHQSRFIPQHRQRQSYLLSNIGRPQPVYLLESCDLIARKLRRDSVSLFGK